MEKISNNNKTKYPDIDKIGLQQCTFYFRRHILNYISNIKISNKIFYFFQSMEKPVQNLFVHFLGKYI